jgi:ABC-type polysaccharide/polyol phosphate export permease
MLLFYATPILYPLTLVPEVMRRWVEINPLVHIVEPIRAALLDGAGISALVTLLPVAIGAAVLLMFARALFRRLSVYFQDFL